MSIIAIKRDMARRRRRQIRYDGGMRAFIFVALLLALVPARRLLADMGGCACGNDTYPTPDAAPNDMAVPRQRDARRQRWRARGRGMVALSAASALALVALRRRRDDRP
jgi:hypothetical protein